MNTGDTDLSKAGIEVFVSWRVGITRIPFF